MAEASELDQMILEGSVPAPFRHLGEVHPMAVAGGDPDLLAFEASEVGDPGALEHEQGVGRVGVGLHDLLDRHPGARPRGDECADVRHAEVGRPARDLGDRIAGPVAAGDVDVDALLFPEPLGPAAEVHGVFAGGDPVGLEMDLVGGERGRRGQQQSGGARGHVESAARPATAGGRGDGMRMQFVHVGSPKRWRVMRQARRPEGAARPEAGYRGGARWGAGGPGGGRAPFGPRLRDAGDGDAMPLVMRNGAKAEGRERVALLPGGPRCRPRSVRRSASHRSPSSIRSAPQRSERV